MNSAYDYTIVDFKKDPYGDVQAKAISEDGKSKYLVHAELYFEAGEDALIKGDVSAEMQDTTNPLGKHIGYGVSNKEIYIKVPANQEISVNEIQTLIDEFLANYR